MKGVAETLYDGECNVHSTLKWQYVLFSGFDEN